MARGQTIADLVIRLQAEGSQEVEYLRKELGQLQKVGKLTEDQLKNQVIAVKSLGKATAGTTNGLKAQIAAFEKIRGNARNTSNVYRDLTNDIRSLNRELKKQIDLETGVPGRAGGILGLLGGGAKQKTRRLYQEKQPKEDTLSYLLGTQYFGSGKGSERLAGTLNEFSRRLEKLQRGFTEISWDDLSPTNKGVLRQLGAYPEEGGKKGRKFEQEARAAAQKAGLSLTQTGTLNKYQMQALGWEGNLDITSKPYLDLVTKITGEQQTQNHLLEQVNNRSAEELATQRARTRQIAAQNKLDVTHIKSSVYQDYVRGLELDARKNRKTSPATMFGMKGRDIDPETKRWQGIDSFWKTTSVIANKLLGIEGSPLTEDIERFDARDTGSLQKYWKTGMRRGSLFTQRKGDKPKSLTQFYEGMPLDDQGIPRAPRGFGKSKMDAKRTIFGGLKQTRDPDPYGLGGPRQYDKTPKGIADQVRDLQQDLLALNPENKEWLQVTEEITAAEKELQAIVDKGTKRLKERRQEIGKKVAARSKNVYGQKLLPAAGGTSAGKMQRDIFLAGKDTGFSADQYGPQLSTIQRATESQKDFVKRLQESVKTGKLNINTLGQQRAKLDEIRNGLDPTSAAFKRATVAIAKTDKALAKLNNNKFSGRNMGRTAQSILGASFFGGPAGFLGSTLGAGVEALRPGGDMAQGAVTGGLIASQVIQPVAGFISGASTYASDIAKLEIALEKATGKGEGFKIALDTVALVTKKFNVPQEIATRGMTRLAAAVTGAGGTVEHAAIAFHNVTAAIKGTAGSGEDVKSAITAMVQIFSKGRVSAEELSGQLGERFPAAVTLFAEANNMTTKELQKGLKDGAIGLDKLWQFVLKLGDKYVDVAEKIGSASVEAGVRSQIAWNEVKLAVGKALQPIGADLQVIGAEILTGLVPALTKLAEITGSVLKTVSGALVVITEHLGKVTIVLGTFITALGIANGQALVAFANALVIVPFTAFIKNLGLAKLTMEAFGAAAGVTTGKMVLLNTAMQTNIFVLAATAIAGAGVAAWHFGRQWQRTVDQIEKGKMPLADARIKVAALEKELQGESNEKMRQRLQTQIQIYKEAIETRIELVNKAKEAEAKAFENSTPKTDRWEDLRKYMTQLKEDSLNLQKVFINAFEAMEESLVKFVKTGKLTFRELANSIIDDLARMIIQQIRYNILAGIMKGLDGGGGIGGFISGLFGGGGGGPAPVNPATLGANATQMTGIPTRPSEGSFGISGAGTGRDPGRHDQTYGTGIPTRPLAGSFGISTIDRGSPASDFFAPYRDFKDNLRENALGNAYGKNGIVPFYKGGIVNRPTLFPFAKGVGLMGEAGPEAIVPLKRGKDGKLGIAGGGGGNITNNIVVNVKTEPGSGSGKTDVKAASSQLNMFGKAISVAVQQELVKQSRPGGLLTRG